MFAKRQAFRFFTSLLVLLFLTSPGWAQESVRVRKLAIAVMDANIRANPTTQSRIITMVRAGEKMEVLDDLGMWLKVKLHDGTVGYVWGKLVRVEVEKIIGRTSPVTSQKPGIVPPLKPAPARVPSPPVKAKEARFDFSFNFTYALVNPDDFWTWGKSFNSQLEHTEGAWRSYGVDTQLDPALGNLKHLLGGDAEIKVFLHRNIAVGLGFSLLKGSKVQERRLDGELGGVTHYLDVSQTLKSSITAPFLALHFVMPSETADFEVFAGTGYYMGRFSADYDFNSDIYAPYTLSFTDMKKSTLGFLAGIRADIKLQKNMGIFVGGKYTFVKFKDLEGKMTYNSSSITGKIYYYEYLTSLGWMPALLASSTAPAPSPGIREIRPAEFNFSGFNVSVGLFFRF